MMRLRVDLAYDGAPYAGFARQPEQTTVQGVLEDALSRVMGHPVHATCAGRTDRGVHAVAQVVHVDVAGPDRDMDERGRAALADLERLRDRLDRMVGEAVSLWRITEVDRDFDARFSAQWRAYRYRLATHPGDPRLRHVVWHVPGPLDVEAMHAAAQAVVGEHDYASFCRKAPGRTTMRRILEAAVAAQPDSGPLDEVHVTLRGTAFCHQMVRAITGSLVEVGRHRRDVEWMAAVLAARDRSAAGPVAPPHGLTLEGVGYVHPSGDAPPASHGHRAPPPSG